jgi:hypothetical protein
MAAASFYERHYSVRFRSSMHWVVFYGVRTLGVPGTLGVLSACLKTCRKARTLLLVPLNISSMGFGAKI